MKTEEKEKKSYDTTNFHIFVWLLMNDVPLIKVFWASDKSGDRDQAHFVFEDFPKRKELIDKFFEQKQLQKWIITTQEAKSRMYANRTPVEYDRK